MATTGQRIPKSTGLSASIIEERRALLQRVLGSRQIEKSARIRDFLVYVCERALRESSVEIHEQEIGSAARRTTILSVRKINEVPMTRRKAFPAILRLRDSSCGKPVE